MKPDKFECPDLDKAPKYWLQESFFDKAVQKVLMEFHPGRVMCKCCGEQMVIRNCFALEAWKSADDAAAGLTAGGAAGKAVRGFECFLREKPLWSTRLLAAVIGFYEAEFKKDDNPQTALAKLAKWRTEVPPEDEQETKAALAKLMAEAESGTLSIKECFSRLQEICKGGGDGGVAKIISETPWKIVADEIYSRSTAKGALAAKNALESALSKENSRRVSIMRRWSLVEKTYRKSKNK